MEDDREPYKPLWAESLRREASPKPEAPARPKPPSFPARPALAIVALVVFAVLVGAIVVLAAVIGRNSDVEVDKYFGWGIIAVGSYGLAVTRTDANFLNFSVTTVIGTYLVGLVLITAGLYSKVAPEEHTGAPRQVREARSAA